MMLICVFFALFASMLGRTQEINPGQCEANLEGIHSEVLTS